MGDAWDASLARALRPQATQRRRVAEAGGTGGDEGRASPATGSYAGIGRFDRGLRRRVQEQTGVLDWLAGADETEVLRAAPTAAGAEDFTEDFTIDLRDVERAEERQDGDLAGVVDHSA
jgi:hypothetical protein